MLYFAYGSNMSTVRMADRLPSAHAVGVAELHGFELCFHKRGMDGSGKCNALPVRGPSARMYGVLYRMDPADKPHLDRIEGLGRGYREATVGLARAGGGAPRAFTYLATHIDGRLKPFSWYVEHVVAGAREWGLPSEYIAMILSVESILDSDAQRATSERAVHVKTNRP